MQYTIVLKRATDVEHLIIKTLMLRCSVSNPHIEGAGGRGVVHFAVCMLDSAKAKIQNRLYAVSGGEGRGGGVDGRCRVYTY